MTNTDKLRIEVNKALQSCLRSATPTICSMAETKEGYEQIEAQIISYCLKKQVTPKQAIAELESEYTTNE